MALKFYIAQLWLYSLHMAFFWLKHDENKGLLILNCPQNKGKDCLRFEIFDGIERALFKFLNSAKSNDFIKKKTFLLPPWRTAKDFFFFIFLDKEEVSNSNFDDASL